MRVGRPSPGSRFAIRFIRTYQLEVSHRLHSTCRDRESCSDYGTRMFIEHGFILASTKTLTRIARCRPPPDARRSLAPRRRKERARRLAAMVAVLGILGAIGALFSPASATVTPGCYGNANGRRFDSITEDSPLRVTLSQRIALRGGAMGSVNSYLVNLYFFGIPYGMRSGTTTDNKWQGTFTASSFLTRGTGNYMVDGNIYGTQGIGTFCFARLYIKVQGDPLSEMPGQAAAGVTATAIIGMIATAVTGGKVPPGFEQTSTPEDEELIRQQQEEETKREERRKREEEENKKLAQEAASKKCVFLVLPALLLTAGMMAAVPAGSATTTPRVRWSPRFSVVGIGSGILLAVGSAVLLQQYGVIWPTLGMGIAFLVGGIAVGIMVPTLARLRVVRAFNRRLADFETRYGAWSPTHRAPDEGLSVWDQPDPSTEPREDIQARVEVRLVERRGDWARVIGEDGRSGWVDSRQLEELEARMPVAPAETLDPAADEPDKPSEEAADIPADWYPDPSGEARMRYWDGTAWTDHTSGQGDRS